MNTDNDRRPSEKNFFSQIGGLPKKILIFVKKCILQGG